MQPNEIAALIAFLILGLSLLGYLVWELPAIRCFFGLHSTDWRNGLVFQFGHEDYERARCRHCGKVKQRCIGYHCDRVMIVKKKPSPTKGETFSTDRNRLN